VTNGQSDNWVIIDGQPESIVHDIENMVRSYIEKVIFLKCFILYGTKSQTLWKMIPIRASESILILFIIS
jgi:hypothetical protein